MYIVCMCSSILPITFSMLVSALSTLVHGTIFNQHVHAYIQYLSSKQSNKAASPTASAALEEATGYTRSKTESAHGAGTGDGDRGTAGKCPPHSNYHSHSYRRKHNHRGSLRRKTGGDGDGTAAIHEEDEGKNGQFQRGRRSLTNSRSNTFNGHTIVDGFQINVFARERTMQMEERHRCADAHSRPFLCLSVCLSANLSVSS